LGFLVWKQTIWQPCWKSLLKKAWTASETDIQGDQIGRIFTPWVIVHIGQKKITKAFLSKFFWSTF
jgi:hypothetical protein